MPEILVAGSVDLDPDRRDAALAAAAPLLEPTRRQEGCVHYHWGADPAVPAPISSNPHPQAEPARRYTPRMQQFPSHVEVEGGGVPVHVQGPDDASGVPGLVVVPSIFGPAPDLLKQMGELSDAALTVVVDPFWRQGDGAVPYEDRETAFGRLKGFDLAACHREMRAVIDWTRERCNGRVAGLGICFGGPLVLTAAGEGALDGIVAWHGSRMEAFLDRASEVTGPVRFHFGSADSITPPEAIGKIREAFAGHSDAQFVVHEGLEHGFSHEGASYDATAALASLEDTRALLASL